MNAYETVLGWSQLAAQSDKSSCQCASGNVIRNDGDAYEVLSFLPVNNQTVNITVDTEVRTFAKAIEARLKLPGGQAIDKTLDHDRAYCVQACFVQKEVHDEMINYIFYLLTTH